MKQWRPTGIVLAVLALGATAACLGGGAADAPQCHGVCDEGETLCGVAGGVLCCQDDDRDGCGYWEPEQPCGANQTCFQSECRCANVCRAGQVRCGPGGGQISCDGPDSAGCFSWGAESEAPCGCADACRAGDTACGPNQGVVTCEGPDPGGCYVWSAEQSCGDHRVCVAGVCVCRDPCRIGQTVCGADSGQRECMGYDGDGCSFWGEPVHCPEPYSCQSELGRCRSETPPECLLRNECVYEGQKACMDSTHYRQCSYGHDGCLVWDCST